MSLPSDYRRAFAIAMALLLRKINKDLDGSSLRGITFSREEVERLPQLSEDGVDVLIGDWTDKSITVAILPTKEAHGILTFLEAWKKEEGIVNDG